MVGIAGEKCKLQGIENGDDFRDVSAGGRAGPAGMPRRHTRYRHNSPVAGSGMTAACNGATGADGLVVAVLGIVEFGIL